MSFVRIIGSTQASVLRHTTLSESLGTVINYSKPGPEAKAESGLQLGTKDMRRQLIPSSVP